MSERADSLPPEIPVESTIGTTAEVVQLPPPDLSRLNIDDYRSPHEFISVFANIWTHPGITSQKLADRICSDTSKDGNEWQQRLYSLFKSWPSNDLTSEQEDDPHLMEIAQFLRDTTKYAGKDDFESQRLAGRILFELCSATILDDADTEAINQVFRKLPRTFTPS